MIKYQLHDKSHVYFETLMLILNYYKQINTNMKTLIHPVTFANHIETITKDEAPDFCPCCGAPTTIHIRSVECEYCEEYYVEIINN